MIKYKKDKKTHSRYFIINIILPTLTMRPISFFWKNGFGISRRKTLFGIHFIEYEKYIILKAKK